MNETAQKILGYIKRLPETWEGQPLRQQALDNFDKKYNLNYPVCQADETNFIVYSFKWRTTTEKHDYWDDVTNKIQNGTIQLLPEEKKDEFVWTDELVNEFSLKWASIKNGYIVTEIEKFKASKNRNVLFITEDGKEIFEGDEYWFVDLITFNGFHVQTASKDGYYEGKKFSTEAAASEYVRLNKPMYSLNDFLKISGHALLTHDQIEIIFTELEKLKP